MLPFYPEMATLRDLTRTVGDARGVLVEAVWYRDGARHMAGDLADVADAAAEQGGFVWAGLHDPDPAEIREVEQVFGLHPLAVEDAIKARQRPKVERYGDWLFVVLRTGRYLDEPEEIDFGEIQIFVSEHAVITVRHGDPVPLAGVRSVLETDPAQLRSGPISVLHAVIDAAVDGYQHCLIGLDDDVNEVELDVFADYRPSLNSRLVERMYFLQREVLELHRALIPFGIALGVLRQDSLVADRDEWDAYFRDIDDHLQRHSDQLQVLREVLGTALSANATQISLRQNEDMRRISAWVAIAAVPTAIAGIYGMNFEHMPELEWVAGYPLVLGLMAAICVTLFRLFRRAGWL